MLKYVVYYEMKNPIKGMPEHYFEEFGELTAAASRLNEVMIKGIYKNIALLKNIAFLTTYSEMEI